MACPWRWCVVWSGRSARALPASWCAPPPMTCFVSGHSPAPLDAVVVERAGDEEGLDGQWPLGQALLAAVAHQRLQRDAIRLDAVRPVVVAHQLARGLDLGDLPGQRNTQHDWLRQLG